MKDEVFSQKVKLRDLRLKLGLTQQQLADSLKMNSRYISMVESGKKPLSDKMLKKVELLGESKGAARAAREPETELLQQVISERDYLRDQLAIALRSLEAALASKPSSAAGRASVADAGDRKERKGA